MKSGRVLKKGTAVLTLNRAAGISEDFFTRGDEFVPERYIACRYACIGVPGLSRLGG